MGIYWYMYLFSERISVDFNEFLLFFVFFKRYFMDKYKYN